jgi:hypothetical protein
MVRFGVIQVQVADYTISAATRRATTTDGH